MRYHTRVTMFCGVNALEVQLDQDRQPDVIGPIQNQNRLGAMVNEGKDAPDAEMVVRAVSLEDGIHETVAVGYDWAICVLDGALQQLLTTAALILTSISEDSFCVRRTALPGTQSVG